MEGRGREGTVTASSLRGEVREEEEEEGRRGGGKEEGKMVTQPGESINLVG